MIKKSISIVFIMFSLVFAVRLSAVNKHMIDYSDSKGGFHEIWTIACNVKIGGFVSALIIPELDDNDAGMIAEALEFHTATLEMLDLGRKENSVTNVGAGYFANMLKINKKLKKLGLGHSQIGDEGARVLGLAIETNTTLLELDLDFCRISNNGARILAESLEKNGALLVFKLQTSYLPTHRIEIDEEIRDKMQGVIGRNICMANCRASVMQVQIFLWLPSEVDTSFHHLPEDLKGVIRHNFIGSFFEKKAHD